MFGSLDVPGSSTSRWLLLFFLQQFGVPIATFVVAYQFERVFFPGTTSEGHEEFHAVVSKLPALYVLPGLAGLPLAGLVHRLIPGASDSGRWIWMWPFTWFLFGLFGPSSHSGSTRLAEAFGPSLAAALVTIPTIACVCYSLRMFLKHKREIVPKELD